jgi:hypothetical protein
MGLSNNNQRADVERTKPRNTPEELRTMGRDPESEPSCAVGTATGVKNATLMGCRHALNCRQFWDGRHPKLGSFAPKSARRDSEGQGPEIILYKIRTNEGDAKEDQMLCETFMESMWSRMVASRHPDENQRSGETIKLLGWADGKQQIVTSETLPEAPGSVTNNRMKTETTVKTPDRYKRPIDVDKDWRVRVAEEAEEQLELSDDIVGESAAGTVEQAAAAPTVKRREESSAARRA